MAKEKKTKSKTRAILKSLFFGWLGADRFYYGYKGVGFLKLLMCIVGFVGIFAGSASGKGYATFLGIVLVAWWPIDLLLICAGKLKPKDIADQEKYDQVNTSYEQFKAKQDGWVNELESKLVHNGFKVSATVGCNDRAVNVPIPNSTSWQTKYYASKLFFIDNENRKIAFGWVDASTRVVCFDFDKIISVEVLYDGVRKTDTTHVVTSQNVGNTRLHVGNSFSNSTDYVNSLGIKLMLRDPANPTFVLPLITTRVLENDSAVKYCEQFATKVKDSITVIIKS